MFSCDIIFPQKLERKIKKAMEFSLIQWTFLFLPFNLLRLFINITTRGNGASTKSPSANKGLERAGA